MDNVGGPLYKTENPFMEATLHMSKPAAVAVYDILEERREQDKQWGGPTHDDIHSVKDWMSYIRVQLMKANNAPAGARERFVKIAALALSAIESIDRREGA